MTAIMHYIYDPLCGWCYGAEPLARSCDGVANLKLRLQGGGLWPRPTKLSDDMRRYIRQADTRIAAMSGQPFREAYLSGLLNDQDLVLDSRPTVTAVLAAESLNESEALPMLCGIQHAHYEHGHRVIDGGVLCDIAAECGLDREAFDEAFGYVDVDAHMAATRALMQRVGAAGFPTFVLQVDDDWTTVPHHRFAANPAEIQHWVRREIESQEAAEA